MEIAFFTTIVLQICFGLLAFFDGVYLHLFKYKLYAHQESRPEHLSHTVRALLFPPILYFLYIEPSPTGFFIGLGLVLADILTLGVDAYYGKG